MTNTTTMKELKERKAAFEGTLVHDAKMKVMKNALSEIARATGLDPNDVFRGGVPEEHADLHVETLKSIARIAIQAREVVEQRLVVRVLDDAIIASNEVKLVGFYLDAKRFFVVDHTEVRSPLDPPDPNPLPMGTILDTAGVVDPLDPTRLDMIAFDYFSVGGTGRGGRSVGVDRILERGDAFDTARELAESVKTTITIFGWKEGEDVPTVVGHASPVLDTPIMVTASNTKG